MNDEQSDEALMLAYQAGDAAAFDELYARHRGGLFRYITRQCRMRTRAEEIFQEVWMSLIQAAHRYRVEAQFRTYLYTLAHHKLMDYFRSNARAEAVLYEVKDENGEMEIVEGVASRTQEPEVRAETRQQGAAILRLLEGLPAPQREAFLLYEESGMSVEEIAEATGVSFEAAKSRLRYAVAKLRNGLAEFA